MSNYTQTTNFATKDALASGNPLKIVKGTEINTEFANIATAVATKADLASPTFTGTVTIPTLAVTTVGVTTISSNPIFSAGTANGVAYLNGSKTLTTGTDLVFDGTNLGVGQSTPVANFRVSTQSSVDGNSGAYVENTSTGVNASAVVRVKNSGTINAYTGLGGTARSAYGGVLGANVLAMYTDNAAGAGILVDAAGPITFGTNALLRASITSAGALNFGATGTNTGTSGQPLISQGSGSAPTWVTGYLSGAWVNFNGTGTPVIIGSGNVSSITDNGVGDYTVNFTTAIADTTYSVATSCRTTAANAPRHTAYNTRATTSVQVFCCDTVGGVEDPTSYSVSVQR